MAIGAENPAKSVPVPFVDVRASMATIGAQVLADIASLIERGAFTNGPEVAMFEQDFAAFCGRRSAVGVASGLDALRLGLAACGLQPGDEVVVPAMTFIATFESVIQAGGRIVVVDVRDDDVGMDPDAAASMVGPRTRFLLPVHLYGQMADVEALAGLATRFGIDLFEDACQAHGASRDGIRAGAAGKAAAFSFYPSKNLGAMGDAGALVLDDDAATETIRALREHGQTAQYRSDYVGYTSRLDTLQALVLSHKLPLLDGWNAERRRAAEFYSDALAGVGDLKLPITVTGATHVWHLYTVRTEDSTALQGYLADHGISTGRHYPTPPHLSHAFADLGLRKGAFPVAEAIARETLSLPIFAGITDEQLETVVERIRRFFQRG